MEAEQTSDVAVALLLQFPQECQPLAARILRQRDEARAMVKTLRKVLNGIHECAAAAADSYDYEVSSW